MLLEELEQGFGVGVDKLIGFCPVSMLGGVPLLGQDEELRSEEGSLVGEDFGAKRDKVRGGTVDVGKVGGVNDESLEDSADIDDVEDGGRIEGVGGVGVVEVNADDLRHW